MNIFKTNTTPPNKMIIYDGLLLRHSFPKEIYKKLNSEKVSNRLLTIWKGGGVVHMTLPSCEYNYK
jgi:hypothetical protein